MTQPNQLRLDRRAAIKWMMTAAAALALVKRPMFGEAEMIAAASAEHGYGADPDMTKSYRPGEVWPLTLTETQRRVVASLGDTIIPADEKSGSASSVGVPDFLDEWVSAPYPQQRADRILILAGLAWIEAEAQRRFATSWLDISGEQQQAICDDICHEPDAKPTYKQAARFFQRFRELTVAGFYTTPVGQKDIGYVGNVPLGSFDGPPAELIAKLGLD